jgi:hypothetical protein
MKVTPEMQGFLDNSRPPEDNSPMSCVLVLLRAIGVVLIVVDLSPVGYLYPSFYIQEGEVTRKVTELVTT